MDGSTGLVVRADGCSQKLGWNTLRNAMKNIIRFRTFTFANCRLQWILITWVDIDSIDKLHRYVSFAFPPIFFCESCCVFLIITYSFVSMYLLRCVGVSRVYWCVGGTDAKSSFTLGQTLEIINRMEHRYGAPNQLITSIIGIQTSTKMFNGYENRPKRHAVL